MANFDLGIDPELEQIMQTIDFHSNGTLKLDIDVKHELSGNLSEIQLNAALGATESPIDKEFDNQDALKYIQRQRSNNTVNKTVSDINKFTVFMQSKGETRDVVTLSPKELDSLLCQFIMEIKKPDGSNYEPDTITGIFR